MTAKGRNLLIKVNVGGTMTLVAGMVSKTYTISRDTTETQTNPLGQGLGPIWRELMPALDTKATIGGSCVFKDDVAMNILEDLSNSGEAEAFEVEFENGDVLSGNFLVTSYEYTGEYLDAQRGSFTLESSGGTPENITMTRAAAPAPAPAPAPGPPPFDVSSLTYTGNFYSVNAVAQFNSVSWLGDGSKFYTSEGGFGFLVRQFNLSTPWTLSSTSYSGNSFDPTPAVFPTRGLFVKPDGSGFYLAASNGSNQAVLQYTMSTGNLSTASYASKQLDISGQVARPDGLFFSPDLTKCYVTENFPDQSIHQYNLSVAGDISTGSHVGSFNTATGNRVDYPLDIFIKSDGLKLFAGGIRDADGAGLVAQFDLSPAWLITSATYDGTTVVTSPTCYEPGSIHFRTDGIRVFFGDVGVDDVFEYET